MTSLRKANFLRLYEIQKILKYLCTGIKRPYYIQYKKKPVSHLLVLLENAPNIAELKRLGLSTVATINEEMEIGVVFKNLLKNLEESKKCKISIEFEDLKYIQKHRISEIFGYSAYISGKSDFDESFFRNFIRPEKITDHFLISIDCEMLMTVDGMRVGRVTLLDHNGCVLYDRYVQPGCAVLDYLSKYSGLSEANTSSGVKYREVQRDVLKYIGTNTYVLGHGLENDLGVLQLYTDKLIDTAYLFLSSEGYKLKLKQLSNSYLKRDIQLENHSSVEDSQCCLELLWYKIRQNRRITGDSVPEIKLGGYKVIRDDEKCFIRENEKCFIRDDEKCFIRDDEKCLVQEGEVRFLKSADLFDYLSKDSCFPKDNGCFLMVFYSENGKNYVAFKETDKKENNP